MPKSAILIKTAVAVCAGGLTLSLAACGSSGDSSSADSKNITAYVGGDTNVQQMWEDLVVPAFEKANPGYHVKVVYSAHDQADSTTLAQLQAAAKTGHKPAYDVFDSGLVKDAAATGLLAKVSASNIPNLASVDQNLLTPVNHEAVPYRGSSVLLAYNSDTVHNPPATYDALMAWIKSHPGRFAYNSPATGGSGGAFVQAALDRHLDEATIHTFQTGYDAGKESVWKAGFADLHALNPYVYGKGVYPNGNQAVLDLLGKGQIDLAPVWSDMFLSAQQTGTLGKNVKVTQVSNPTISGGASYLGVAKNAPHLAAALKLTDFFLDPSVQAMLTGKLAAYPVIPISKLPAAVQNKFTGLDIAHLRPAYSGRSTNDMNSMWQQEVPGT